MLGCRSEMHNEGMMLAFQLDKALGATERRNNQSVIDLSVCCQQLVSLVVNHAGCMSTFQP